MFTGAYECASTSSDGCAFTSAGGGGCSGLEIDAGSRLRVEVDAVDWGRRYVRMELGARLGMKVNSRVRVEEGP